MKFHQIKGRFRADSLFQVANFSIWGWGSLVVVLFFVTFGPFAIFYFAFYVLSFVGGGFVVTLLFGKTNFEKYLELCEHSFLPPNSTGIPKCLEEMRREARIIKIDRRLTGANIIDEPLQQVIQFSLRDCVQYWYYTLSDDESFLLEIRQMLQNVLIQFSTRSKEIDWQLYFTTHIADDFGTHLRVFRKAQQKITEKDEQTKGSAEDLVETFFEVEVEMEKDTCRDLVCTSSKEEEGFLRDLCEVLLYLLLPPGDFQNKIMRYFVREILARGILLPLINQLGDPDYINQYIIWMIRDSNCNYEAFMNIIKLSDNVGELEVVRDKAMEELQYLRSLDTAGDDTNTIKNQINSLLFVKKVCDSRIQRLQSGKEIDTVKLAAHFGKLHSPLGQHSGRQCCTTIFHGLHAADGRSSSSLLLDDGGRVPGDGPAATGGPPEPPERWEASDPPNQRSLKSCCAVGIYEQYLSEKASPRVHIDDYLVAKLADTLNHQDPTPEIFVDIQRKVYDLMLRDERFYPSFKQNVLYVRMLAELDMLKDSSFRGSDDGDGESFNRSPTGSINLSLDDLSSVSSDDSVQLHAYISDTDHVNGHCTSPTSQSCSSGKRLSSADVSKVNRWGPGRPPFRKAQSAACMEVSLPVTTEEIRENSYNRSRSSSISSIDKETKEAITALYFMESFARKNDMTISPCLWVGTSLGMVLMISFNLPSTDEQRYTEPVLVSPSGTLLTLKGAVLTFSCMDRLGGLMHPPYEVWRDPNSMDDNEKGRKRKLVMNSPSTSQEMGDHQYAVVCSEKQAKVFSLPSQTCLYIHNITETSFILQAAVVVMCNSACLACFCANGHIMIMSLPSLRPMLDVNYLPLTDMRIARTFCFTNEGQALYLVSPTEIQRLTYSQEMCDNLQDMLGELFTPVETPEAQNRGFLKGLFGGSGQTFDREELFGEASAGKASKSLAQHIPGSGGIEGVKGAAGGVMGELTRARIALDERGQRLGELEEKTAGMMTSAEAFSKHAHELMLKYKDKKWYQF